MGALRAALATLAVISASGAAFAQAEFRVYEDHPRIFLEKGRLERLRRDVDRQSLRWQTLAGIVSGGRSFDEQPLVDALRFQAEGSAEAGQRAVRWAVARAGDGIGTAADLRLAALVYDWCHGLFEESQLLAVRDAMAAAIAELLPRAGIGPGLIRAAILASIALAGDWDGSEAALATLLSTHWRREVAPALAEGRLSDDAADLIATMEAALVVRHNLERDPLAADGGTIRSLAHCRLLSYYPVDIDTPQGRMRRPSRFGADEQAARDQAPLDRIAEMLLVAYEANLREFQFVQGWIRDEAYLSRSSLLAPYEFLWVNPYLPGLTAESSPLVAYDKIRGRLFGRSRWDGPSMWLGYSDGRLEILEGGELSATDSMGGLPPVYFPNAVAVPMRPPARVTLSWEPRREEAPESVRVYLIGLRGGETYGLRIGGREARLIEAGAGGVAVVHSDPGVPKRDRIDFRRKVRLEVKPTLKPTRPGRRAPSLLR